MTVRTRKPSGVLRIIPKLAWLAGIKVCLLAGSRSHIYITNHIFRAMLDAKVRLARSRPR